MDVQQVLAELGIEEVNSGAYAGGWIETHGSELKSINPATGETIATIVRANGDDYEKVAASSVETFERWRMLPAPQRGEYVRQIGNALREKKDALGALVTIEMGKILPEGGGEVQEMIDIADFAVGLSRQLYGLTMASERPLHRMYEQWHPLGPVGSITSFNFRRCGDEDLRRGHGRYRLRGCLQPGYWFGFRRRRSDGEGSSSAADLGYRIVRHGIQGRNGGRQEDGSFDPGTRRQQRHHRDG